MKMIIGIIYQNEINEGHEGNKVITTAKLVITRENCAHEVDDGVTCILQQQNLDAFSHFLSSLCPSFLPEVNPLRT